MSVAKRHLEGKFQRHRRSSREERQIQTVSKIVEMFTKEQCSIIAAFYAEHRQFLENKSRKPAVMSRVTELYRDLTDRLNEGSSTMKWSIEQVRQKVQSLKKTAKKKSIAINQDEHADGFEGDTTLTGAEALMASHIINSPVRHGVPGVDIQSSIERDNVERGDAMHSYTSRWSSTTTGRNIRHGPIPVPNRLASRQRAHPYDPNERIQAMQLEVLKAKKEATDIFTQAMQEARLAIFEYRLSLRGANVANIPLDPPEGIDLDLEDV